MVLSMFLLPRMRRKGIYGSFIISAALFFVTKLLFDNNTDGLFDTAKLITGVASKFGLAMYFGFATQMMGEINPTGIRQTSYALHA